MKDITAKWRIENVVRAACVAGQVLDVSRVRSKLLILASLGGIKSQIDAWIAVVEKQEEE